MHFIVKIYILYAVAGQTKNYKNLAFHLPLKESILLVHYLLENKLWQCGHCHHQVKRSKHIVF